MAVREVAPTRAGRRQWFGFAVLMIPVLLVAIDNTALTFALPAMSVSLSPSGVQLMWIVDSYSLVLAGLLVVMGSLGDRIGRRKLLLIGAAGFGAASLYAATSSTPEHLIVARALQGVFGATLMPSTMSLIRNLFSRDRDRRIAIATWAAMFGGGAALGPVVAGWLLEHFSWGSIFLINLPLIAVFLPLGFLLLAESKDPDPGRIDSVSILLSMGALAPAVFALKHGMTRGIDILTITTAGFAVVCGIAFTRRQRGRAHPMLDMSLLRNPVFSGSIVANMLSLMAMAGFLFFAAQLLQLDLGMGELESALVLLPGTIVSMGLGFVAVRLVEHLSVRSLIPAGLLLAGLGYAISAFGQRPTAGRLLLAFVVMGIGIGIAETLTNDLVLAHAPAEKAGAASALNETAYELGVVLGTAVIGSVLTATYQARLHLPSGTPDAAPETFETLGSTLEFAAARGGELGTELGSAAREAFDAAVQNASLTAIVVVVVAALLGRRAFRNA